jgi:TetR/AcrR family transcriptional regulator, mexCD-oprJ operon repressor
MPEPAPIRGESVSPVPRNALRERVASEILAAAARVLVSTGGKASMNDVAAAAGIARATLYRYFPTRSALVDRLRLVATQEAKAKLEASRVDQVEPLEGLERIIRAFVDVGDVFVVSARERGRAGGEEFDESIVIPLRSLLERGQEGGVIRTDVDAMWLTESLIGLILSGASSRMGTEDTIAAIKRLFLEGAGTR